MLWALLALVCVLIGAKAGATVIAHGGSVRAGKAYKTGGVVAVRAGFAGRIRILPIGAEVAAARTKRRVRDTSFIKTLLYKSPLRDIPTGPYLWRSAFPF